MNERNKRIVGLIESGKKTKEIAEEYGISYQRVREINCSYRRAKQLEKNVR